MRTAFAERGRTGGNLGGLNSPFSADLRASVERLAAQLGEEPRHELFAPECKKWLLKLAFGPRENRRVAAQ